MNWQESLTVFIITVLVYGVGRLIKTVRNTTVKKTAVLRPYYETESGTLFCLLLYSFQTTSHEGKWFSIKRGLVPETEVHNHKLTVFAMLIELSFFFCLLWAYLLLQVEWALTEDSSKPSLKNED